MRGIEARDFSLEAPSCGIIDMNNNRESNMVFSSVSFLCYFLPVVLLIYFSVPARMRNGVLLCASFLFYFWGEPKYCLLMAAAILSGYFFGRWIEMSGKKAVCALGVAVHVLLLIYFKYTDFLILSMNRIFQQKLPLLYIGLPIGISFYTFQIISYLIDVKRKKYTAEKNMISFAMYVSSFPQLIAGPIVRYQDIREEMKIRFITADGLYTGMRRFVMGLAKKAVLADSFAQMISILERLPERSPMPYWMSAVGFALQIYYDFSGYSDMAIGLGAIFGFRFPENFDYPYMAKSVGEFFKRWHITLGAWFRDYVYIPLGGSRAGMFSCIANLLLVWALTGLWHGADYHFLWWGIYFAVFRILEKGMWWGLGKINRNAGSGAREGRSNRNAGSGAREGKFNGNARRSAEEDKSSRNAGSSAREGKIRFMCSNDMEDVETNKILHRWLRALQHIYALLVILVGFLIFQGPDMAKALENISGLFWGNGRGTGISLAEMYYGRSYGVLLAVGIIGATPFPKKIWENRSSLIEVLWVLAAGVTALAYLVDGNFQPFLYFRF